MSMGDMSPGGMGGSGGDEVAGATDGGFEKFRKMREEAAARAAAEVQPPERSGGFGSIGKKGEHANSSGNGKKSGGRGGGDDDWDDWGSGAGKSSGKGGSSSKARGGGDDWDDDWGAGGGGKSNGAKGGGDDWGDDSWDEPVASKKSSSAAKPAQRARKDSWGDDAPPVKAAAKAAPSKAAADDGWVRRERACTHTGGEEMRYCTTVSCSPLACRLTVRPCCVGMQGDKDDDDDWGAPAPVKVSICEPLLASLFLCARQSFHVHVHPTHIVSCVHALARPCTLNGVCALSSLDSVHVSCAGLAHEQGGDKLVICWR